MINSLVRIFLSWMTGRCKTVRWAAIRRIVRSPKSPSRREASFEAAVLGAHMRARFTILYYSILCLYMLFERFAREIYRARLYAKVILHPVCRSVGRSVVVDDDENGRLFSAYLLHVRFDPARRPNKKPRIESVTRLSCGFVLLVQEREGENMLKLPARNYTSLNSSGRVPIWFQNPIVGRLLAP